MTLTPNQLGNLAYRAFCTSVKNKYPDGETPRPHWDDLSDTARTAWSDCALAVSAAVRTDEKA